MNDDQLLRYSRHILLEEWDVAAQQKVLDARVLILGAGGLGCPAALFLAAAGVGEICIVDGDTVDLTNLQRQIAHSRSSLGHPKVVSIKTAVAALNEGPTVRAIDAFADDALLAREVPRATVVLDCTDHFSIRHTINRACHRARVPLVFGAALRFDGQVTTFDFRRDDSPCYACLFPPEPPPEEASCATMGVFAPAVGLIGTIQAAEALKVITGVGSTLFRRLSLLDALAMQWREIRYQQQADCPVCGKR